jgi:Protein of unknown function (DUF3276)
MGCFMTRLPNIISSVKLSAGNRTYFLDMESHGGIGVCLVINESRWLAQNKFERHRIIVDQDHLDAFALSLGKVLQKAGHLGRLGAGGTDKLVVENLTGQEGEMPRRSFAAVRQSYPRAYKPWSSTDDEQLKDAYSRCKEPRILADTFGRNPGGIQSRLRKLGLIL